MMFNAAGDIDGFFLGESPLASVLHGFSPRPEQLEMARRVAQAISSGKHLAVEAGAGTGKTLAYLIPALLSGRRVIVATGTRTLQDQLFHRDLPVLGRALGRPARVALLKGRSNYLCLYRLSRALQFPDGARRRLLAELRRIEQWALRTESGDISELTGVEEQSPVWPLVTSTADNCLGGRCPDIERCHVMAARRKAASCDLAVVNHHLLLADMALGEDGFSRLLPGTEAVIVDEAHRFPETAQAAFDVTLSSRQIGDLLRDAQAEAIQAGAIDADLRAAIEALAERLRGVSVPGAGEAVAISAAPQALTDVLQALAQDLDYLEAALAVRADLSPGLGRCRERSAVASAAAARVVAWQEGEDLCWAQGGPDSFAVHLTPLDVAAALRERMQVQPCTWIFASATLAVGDDFSHFARRIGVAPLDTCRIDSPFDYNRCARLLLPSGMPSPDSPQYTEAVVDAVAPLLRASRGRAFLLFTSRRALQRAAALLQERDHGHRLLVQGSASRSRLLDEFVRSDQAVLLGTATFWEGVDIRGPALVVVAIDRLPFASPGDPFLQARLERVRREGGDPFRDYQLPHAVLTLRQGVGRLIRGYDDYGVIVICDPRLTGRGYGRVFMASLPPMPLVRNVEEACEFLASRERAP